MKNVTWILASVGMAFGAALLPSLGRSEVLFADGFESGDFSHKQGGAAWTSMEKVTVVSSGAKSGKYAAKFHFPGNTDPTADSWSELRFDSGKEVTEFWIQYDLFIPTNFHHRTPSGPANDKFFRLWGNTYDDIEKVGASTFPNNGYSSMYGEWDDKVLGLKNGGGMTAYPPQTMNAITESDVGKWVTYKIFVKAATASSNATLKIWKNGNLLLDDTNLINDYTSGEMHTYRYGYILGWSNSGYDEDTDFLLDNVIMATQESDLGASSSSPPAADGSIPNPPILTVK